MRPGDDDQLGPGWFWREDWGKLGTMRWTGGRAEAYLGHDGQATRVCVRAYSGETRLGPVSGRARRRACRARRPRDSGGRGRRSPSQPDTWAELAVPLRAPAGLIRITIYAEPLRIPRDRVPGSGDGRGLGLAIKRLWLAG